MFSIIRKLFVKEKMKKLNDDLYVGNQIGVEDIPELTKMGFKTIVCNRPDKEGPDQTDFEELKSSDNSDGLDMHFIPFYPGQLTIEDVENFSLVLKNSPKPIFAFCLSGGRSIQIAKAAYQLLEENNK
tara:strand:- start:15 stop:398 length:384 start_codon:yes stop_codon:yes gene_type:complete